MTKLLRRHLLPAPVWLVAEWLIDTLVFTDAADAVPVQTDDDEAPFVCTSTVIDKKRLE